MQAASMKPEAKRPGFFEAARQFEHYLRRRLVATAKRSTPQRVNVAGSGTGWKAKSPTRF
jgi:hypothetical protein